MCYHGGNNEKRRLGVAVPPETARARFLTFLTMFVRNVRRKGIFCGPNGQI
jgi:hypothetical protein